ncbi:MULTISPECIES: response regulator transcription factor [Flavobacterium]|jgi:DNA-binding NarL/FixJ family response regulator|uniref:DNA-binding NarL/FixJ family response regulator n=1 Tax=Flavobacterium lindanitolerans TaxID=428988 RepID=A0A497UVQ2_9FLAO|nr:MULTISPECIES: response regulator transcription factor [Flavobacterium]PZO32050.1 MAG: DNA-binding response regulator [Flavobacteriaceae bacterium]PZQ84678.1 MAG: DNA-binding response regulator [Flavobacterium johnsoniae]KQS50303.1 LuxR family transcriptional regulator [Flavobacterium sp. Leaf359]MBL7867071.1 response regulator transcription factor [Flavobacterium lindanitolerans]OJX52063.1 MAG: DNA-binding response regulator [Flavobacterium sp. 38-13]
MIKICLADNHPIVHYGIKSYFKDNSEISIVGHAEDFTTLEDILNKKSVDIVILDLDLEGLSSINLIKGMVKDYPSTKIVIFTNLSEQMYAPNALKAGVSAYIHKTSKLENLASALIKVYGGAVVFSETVKKNLALIGKRNKSERLYRKLSTREIEVLRYLSDGKKNKEIAKILDLNEKTVSTYKLRLLTKLNVTNLVDLVNKAKTLEIV